VKRWKFSIRGSMTAVTATVFMVLLFSGFISESYGHGVTASARIGRAVITEIQYDDGEPFSYSPIKVYSPRSDKIEYQNGRTDARGLFAFVPDATGAWRISATDDMAHGKEITFRVRDLQLSDTSGAWSDARKQKLVSAFLLIWAVAATSLYIGTRSKLRRKASGPH